MVVVQRIKGIHDMSLPALYLYVNEKPQLFSSLIEYFIAHGGKSLSWMRNLSRGLGLLFDYTSEFKRQYPEFELNGKGVRELIRRFAWAHTKGTINTETGKDPLELYWPPSRVEITKKYLTAVTDFIAWCEAEGYVDKEFSPNNSSLNEYKTLRLLYIVSNMKLRSMLKHIYDNHKVAKNLALRQAKQIVKLGHSSHMEMTAEGKVFPPHLIVPLIEKGFIAKNGSEDITAKMYTMLLMFGGLRVSEPCHIWFNDVAPQHDGTCRAVLRHPEAALTHFDSRDKRTRAQYLKEIGLLPRNDTANDRSYHAGWKNLSLGADKTALIWFIHQGAEKLFGKYYLVYLRHREHLMKARRDKGLIDHPFLFVRQDIEGIGEPYSISAYGKALDRAYLRLESLGYQVPRGKYKGTTPHGMRHWFGQTLEDANMPDKVIQSCMHHKNVLSQQIYTSPKYSTIKQNLDNAKALISNGDIKDIPLSLSELGSEF